MTRKHDNVSTIVAEAVEAGVRFALINVELAVLTGEALVAVAVVS